MAGWCGEAEVRLRGREARNNGAAGTKKPASENRRFRVMAEKEGFEPSIRCYRIHTFQACSFSHSDTSPENSDEWRVTSDAV